MGDDEWEISESYVSPDGPELEPSERRDRVRLWTAYRLVGFLAALRIRAPKECRDIDGSDDHDLIVDLGEAFDAHAQRVREGEAARTVAGEYLLHNSPGPGREVIARVLEVRASAGSREEAVGAPPSIHYNR